MRHSVVAALLATSLVVGCTGVPPSAPAAPITEEPTTPGVVVPLYVYPAGDGLRAWDAVATAARQSPDVPVIAVVNPDNGPGRSADSNYRSVVAELGEAGAEPAAYVALGFGHRPAREVRSDLRRWRRLYPSITAVFFDEVPVPGNGLSPGDARTYVTEISAYAAGRGFTGTMIGNPGTAAPASYAAPDAFDLVVIHEDRWWPSPEAVDAGPPAEESVVLVYGDGVWDASRARRLAAEGRYLFVDDHSLDIVGNGTSPWTFFPNNLDEQLQVLREYGGSSSDGRGRPR
ncbi:MAG: spherulation-specific family 4 protein [Alkalispirochaeta sp.]